jgi:hypothetical protein
MSRQYKVGVIATFVCAAQQGHNKDGDTQKHAQHHLIVIADYVLRTGYSK